jgi:hypothetical protein
VEVPLPLGVTELPVVGDELELAELAAGSPIVDPAPWQVQLLRASWPSLSDDHDNSEGESRVPPLFRTIDPPSSTAS